MTDRLTIFMIIGAIATVVSSQKDVQYTSTMHTDAVARRRRINILFIVSLDTDTDTDGRPS